MPQASQILNSYSIGCGDAGALVLQVRVRVDQSRQHVLAGRVDLGGARVAARAAARAAPERDRIERDELRDRAALDDDVERPFAGVPLPSTTVALRMIRRAGRVPLTAVVCASTTGG